MIFFKIFIQKNKKNHNKNFVELCKTIFIDKESECVYNKNNLISKGEEY